MITAWTGATRHRPPPARPRPLPYEGAGPEGQVSRMAEPSKSVLGKSFPGDTGWPKSLDQPEPGRGSTRGHRDPGTFGPAGRRIVNRAALGPRGDKVGASAHGGRPQLRLGRTNPPDPDIGRLDDRAGRHPPSVDGANAERDVRRSISWYAPDPTVRLELGGMKKKRPRVRCPGQRVEGGRSGNCPGRWMDAHPVAGSTGLRGQA